MSQLASSPKPVMSRKSTALQGAIAVPGDKSISHRALILGTLAEGVTEIGGLLESDDVLCTARALQQLGAGIERSEGRWTVTGRGLGGLIEPEAPLDFGNSGTGARLMMGVVAGHPISATFTGDASLCRRPMGRVLDPLRRMGLDLKEQGKATLPLTLVGTAGLTPIVYNLPVASAQVKSAVLLAGLLALGDTSVVERERTRDHTERMLAYLGVGISSTEAENGFYITVEGRKSFKGKTVSVPGDPSSAAFLVAAAILCPGSEVLIRKVLINPTRIGFYKTLAEMGAAVSFVDERELNGERVADISVKSSRLRGVHVPGARAPAMIDEYPILSVLAAFAEGDTVMEGLSELRVKESDRLAAIQAGLSVCGVPAEIDGDALRVRGSAKVRGGGTVATHMDHRIAMAFLVLGLASDEPVIVDDTSMIATSFPEFPQLLQSLGASLEAVPGPAAP